MASNFRGKVALITGGSQGIGFAIAQALAAEGCDLIVSARNQTRLNQAAKQLAKTRVSVLPVVCDVREEASVDAMIAAVKKRFRRLDFLVNNAGIAHEGLPVEKLPLAAWRDVIETNLTGMFLVTKAALPIMKRGGVILNNLSVAAKTP